MTQAVLRLPARLLGGRLQISPVLLSLSLAPITVILVLVIAMFWISFQRECSAPPRRYTLSRTIERS